MVSTWQPGPWKRNHWKRNLIELEGDTGAKEKQVSDKSSERNRCHRSERTQVHILEQLELASEEEILEM